MVYTVTEKLSSAAKWNSATKVTSPGVLIGWAQQDGSQQWTKSVYPHAKCWVFTGTSELVNKTFFFHNADYSILT